MDCKYGDYVFAKTSVSTAAAIYPPGLLLYVTQCSMTRPYTATEFTDESLNRPEWTDRYGDYVFANSSDWPSALAVSSLISIGSSEWKVRLHILTRATFLEHISGWCPSCEHDLQIEREQHGLLCPL